VRVRRWILREPQRLHPVRCVRRQRDCAAGVREQQPGGCVGVRVQRRVLWHRAKLLLMPGVRQRGQSQRVVRGELERGDDAVRVHPRLVRDGICVRDVPQGDVGGWRDVLRGVRSGEVLGGGRADDGIIVHLMPHKLLPGAGRFRVCELVRALPPL
jgi:hypothetical protein